MLSGSTAVTATFETTRVDKPLKPAPAPVLRDLSPASAGAGTTALTLVVKGRSFVAGSVVHWNGAARTTRFVSARELQVAIPAVDLATPASVPVTVVTPAPGGGTSGSLTFTVTAAPGGSTATTPTTLSLSSGSVDRDIVVDNADPGVQDSVGGRTFTGTWCRAGAPTRFGSTSLFACGTGVNTYRWTPRIPVSGFYEVYVWIAASPYLSGSVPFVVTHTRGTALRTFDQQSGSGRWVLHGRYYFEAGRTGYVEVGSEQARAEGGPAGADAVRFVRRR
jgi:hypothetical protein